jgi:cell division protein FtsQ
MTWYGEFWKPVVWKKMARRSRKNKLQEELRERRQKLGRLVLLFVVLLGGAAVTAAIYIKLTDEQTLPLRVVRIEGVFKHLDKEALKQVLARQLNRNFLAIDIDAIHADLKGVPWVDQVTVRRKWPDTLMLTVQEQMPLARWRKGGLVNQRGEWFAGDLSDAVKLPELDGPQDTVAILSGEYLYLNQELKALGLQASTLTMTRRRAWKLGLENGLMLQLGRMQVHARLQRFMKIYQQIIDKQLEKIESVDMRYTNGFAVHWKPGNDIQNNNNGDRKDV